jgi:protein-disulfide isomerase
MSARATIVLFLAVIAGGPRRAGAEEAPPPAGAVARVGDETLTQAQVDEIIKGPLTELRMRENTLRAQGLEELIAQTVLGKEATAHGTTVSALLKSEVEQKAAPTEAELKAYYEANKERFKNLPEADALKQIEPGLRQQQQRARQSAYLRELRRKYGVKVLLEPMRLSVNTAGAPVRGNEKAPVTIVEFSDFQCPFCARARPTVNRVREAYGDKVRILFRDFPLQMHPQAMKAAEAASCAGDQGKFWEMHDRLFAGQSKLQVPDLKQYATELGLEAGPFGECLDSGKYASKWQQGLAEGTQYGVTGTPAFFINGRPLMGARPFEDFAAVIDDELERGAAAPQDPAKGAPLAEK